MTTFKKLIGVFPCALCLVQACGESPENSRKLQMGGIFLDGQLQSVAYEDVDENHALIWDDVLVRKERIIRDSHSATYLSTPSREMFGFATWPDARVPYELPQDFPKNWLPYWETMINEWKRADINWVPKSSTDTSYVQVQLKKGITSCAQAFVGWQKDQPSALIVRDPSEFGTCQALIDNVFLHESAHSLAFNHEHQRSDRDSYIKFSPKLPTEITTSSAFEPFALMNALTPFDFGSVTLYGHYFVKIDGSSIPTAKKLSDLDVEGARRLYHSKISLSQSQIRSTMNTGDVIGKITVSSTIPGPYSLRIIRNPFALPVSLVGDSLVLTDSSKTPIPAVYELIIEAKSHNKLSFFKSVPITVTRPGQPQATQESMNPTGESSPLSTNAPSSNPENPTSATNNPAPDSAGSDFNEFNSGIPVSGSQVESGNAAQDNPSRPSENTLSDLPRTFEMKIEKPSQNQMKAPVWLEFKSMGQKGSSFLWQFSDTSSASSQTVFKSFEVAGEYSIKHSWIGPDGMMKEETYVLKID